MGPAINPQIEGALGTVGALTAFLLFAAPINTFKRILTSRSTEEFSPFPYVSTLLNCTVWVLYALPFITPNRTSPLVTNVIGILFQVAYIVIFVKNAREKPKHYVFKLLGGYISVVGLVLFITVALPSEARSSMLGYCATVFTVLMFGSPLSAVAVVLTTKSVEFMPLPLSLMGFACSSSWAVYGIYVQDYFVIIPNAIGMVLGIIQLLIYFWISRESLQRKLSRGELSEMELTEKEPLYTSSPH